MVDLVIHNFGDALMERLADRAAERGRSVEEEAREMVQLALANQRRPGPSIGEQIHSYFAPMGGVELDIPPREQPGSDE